MTGPIHPMVPVLNVPSKPQVQGAATGRSQKDRRRTDTMWDIHRHATCRDGRFVRGRPWCGERELAANRDVMPPPPDGFIMGDLMQGEYVVNDQGVCDRAATLASVWTAPWRPLAKYFRFNYARSLITFDYTKMKLEEEQGLQRYYRAASKLGVQLNIIVEPGKMPHGQIVAELGEPSRMNRIAEAAMAGDAWLLGFIDEPNPVLAEILGIEPQSGIFTPQYSPVSSPVQAQTVAAVIAAPPQTDLLDLVAKMAAAAATSAVEAAFDKREQADRERKEADKARMAKVRAARKPVPV